MVGLRDLPFLAQFQALFQGAQGTHGGSELWHMSVWLEGPQIQSWSDCSPVSFWRKNVPELGLTFQSCQLMKCSLTLLPGRAIHSTSGKPSGWPLRIRGQGKDKRSSVFLFYLLTWELPGGVVLELWAGPKWAGEGYRAEAERLAQVGSLGACESIVLFYFAAVGNLW